MSHRLIDLVGRDLPSIAGLTPVISELVVALDGVLELVTDGWWVWDLIEQDCEYLSARFWRTFGRSPAAHKHAPSEWQSIIHADDVQRAVDMIPEHVADPAGSPYIVTCRYKHAAGHWVPIQCRGHVLKCDDGTPVAFVGLHQTLDELGHTVAEARAHAHKAAQLAERLAILAPPK